MRVLLDANVYLSALIFRSTRMYSLVDRVVTQHEVVITEFIVREVLDVTSRKMPGALPQVTTFLLSGDLILSSP